MGNQRDSLKRSLAKAVLLGTMTLSLAGCVEMMVGSAVVGTFAATDRRTFGAQTEDKAIIFKGETRASSLVGERGHVNVTSFNPKAEYEGRLVELAPLGTEGQFRGEEYYTLSAGWMYGGGFKVDLSYRLSLNFEIAARALGTDYLDDVSGTYPNKENLRRARGSIAVALSDRSIPLPGVENSQLGREGVQRGNSKNNDTYVFIGAGVMYYFGGLKCPDGGSRKRR